MKYKNAVLITVLALLLTASAWAGTDTATELSKRSPVFLQTENEPLDEATQEQWNSATPLPTSRSSFELSSRLAYAMQTDDEGNVDPVNEDDAGAASTSSAVDKKNPGRALLLSAIMPGAGELYAGKKLRAAFFFAVEMACWYGAITFAQQGQDKESEYEAFADDHWLENVYLQKEYNAATDPSVGNEGAYPHDQAQWENEDWQEKINYLPVNFTHELPDERTQQYYESIGKYLTQFGWAWDDATQVAAEGNPYQWAGTSARVNLYIDMRDESNKLLDRSATFFSVIMVNHVVSALHAGFTVRAMNKSAEVEPQVGQVWHNDQPVAVAGLNFRF